MAKDYPRSYRVADQVQQVLSTLIRDEIKDPRLSPLLTISSVEVSRDLSVARVYYTLMDDSGREDTAAALSSSTGFMRRRLGQLMTLRAVPQLQFHYDNSIQEGARMDALIKAAVDSNTTESDPSEDTGAPGDMPGDNNGPQA